MPDIDLLKFVLMLEERVWEAVVQRDRSALSELFAADYLEITLEGQRVERSVIVEESPQVDEITHYSIEAARVLPLAAGSLLLSYHLRLTGKCRGVPIEPPDRWATSVWRQNDGVWRCRFFQQSAYTPSENRD